MHDNHFEEEYLKNANVENVIDRRKSYVKIVSIKESSVNFEQYFVSVAQRRKSRAPPLRQARPRGEEVEPLFGTGVHICEEMEEPGRSLTIHRNCWRWCSVR